MSSESWVSPQRAKTRSICSSDWTSHGSMKVEPIDSASGPHALLDQALDRREADLGALGVERLGDPPGDRVVVGDAEDERRLAVEQSHPVLRACRRRAAYHRRMARIALRARAPRACAGWSSMPTASSSSRASRCRARSTRSGASRIARIPFRVVTNFSQIHRETLARWMRQERARDRPGPDHHGDLGHGRLHRGGPSRAGRCSCSPPTDARREFDGQRLLTADEADALPAGDGRGGRHRRCRRRPVVPEHGRRLPAGPGRRGAARDAPQPVVADADAGDARRGRRTSPGSSSRPAAGRTILGKPSPVVFRQAVAGLQRGPRRAARRVRRSRWSATTCGRRRRRAAGRAARDPRPVGQDRRGGGRACRDGRAVAGRTASAPRWPTSSPR